MKLIGAIAVIVGCGAFGLLRCRTLSHQAACISAAAEALRYMASELRATAPPLPELMDELSRAAPPPVRGFFARLSGEAGMIGEESFEVIWKRTVFSEDTLLLGESSRRILAGAGEFMGRFSCEEQAEALERCAYKLESEYRIANEKAREGRRLYPGLGLTVGVMLAAVFL